MPVSLPNPGEIAQQHSKQLQLHLKKIIAAQQKISFHDFMQIALYEPGLGYYSAGCHKLGVGGDFITAPELSPLFGRAIAQSLLPFDQTNWLELGAGTGKLAADILSHLAAQQKLPQHYYILEVSADLKQRQQVYLQESLSPILFAKIIWLEHLPEQFSGIILANEVLDALPIHRFQVTPTYIKEYYVTIDEQQQLVECLDTPSSDYLTQRIAALNLDSNHYCSEINLQQELLLKTLSNILDQGLILFIDYGFPTKEFYHPDRNQGTFMCHYQHYAHHNPLFWPGLQDMTSHVNFTALAHCGIEHHLALINFTTQASWLLEAGIMQLAEKYLAQLSPAEHILTQKALYKLLAPEEMGELFKVILFAKKIEPHALNPQFFDMRHRL